MSGHSKWANIKHKKAKEDATRGKVFTKLSKEITIAAKEGGDPNGNPRLRTLLEKARDVNMPADNVKRAIQKGTGELPGVSYEKHMYEGYGPGGIAVILEVLTDNKNRAIAELRHVFSRKGGNIAEGGAVSWMFSLKGIIRGPSKTFSEDELFEKLMDFDVEDVKIHESSYTVTCSVKAMNDIQVALKGMGLTVEHAEPEWVAKDFVEPSEADAEKAIDFLQSLDELEDIQNVYSNLG